MNRTTTGMAGMGGRAALRLALMLGAPAGLAFVPPPPGIPREPRIFPEIYSLERHPLYCVCTIR